MMPQGEDSDFDQDIVAYKETQRTFAANFFQSQIIRYEMKLGHDAAVRFALWWKNFNSTIALFAETQQEFDREAFLVCDEWLSKWIQRQAKVITAVSSEPEDSLARAKRVLGAPSLVVPPSIPPKSWKPCKHWMSVAVPEEEQRLCENCAAERESMVGQYSERARVMYDNHRRFVWKQLHAELRSRTTVAQHPEFYDIESQVWMTVNARIAGYAERGTPLAWLEKVIHSTVEDYFEAKYRTKRGALVTSNTTEGDADKLYQEPDGTRWEGKVTPEGHSADADDPGDEDTVDT